MRTGARLAGYWRVRLAVPGLRRRWGSPAERLPRASVSALKRLRESAVQGAVGLSVQASRSAREATTPLTPGVGEASVERLKHPFFHCKYSYGMWLCCYCFNVFLLSLLSLAALYI